MQEKGAEMKLTVSAGGVPAGNYVAKFKGIEPYQDKENKYGEGLRWTWQVEKGPHAGQTASRITGCSPSPKNACGKILSGLLNRPVQPSEEVDINDFVGKSYLIVVGAAESGTRVETVLEATTA
jgi:hypothetical protein